LLFGVLPGILFAQPPRTERAEALLRRATIGMRNDEYLKARSLLDSALMLAGEMHNDALRARVLTQLGIVDQSMGERNQALSSYYSALRIQEGLGDTAGMAELYNNIGSIHHYEHEYIKAAWYYHRSLDLRLRTGGPRDVAKLYNNLGSLYEEQGKLDSALMRLRQALSIWEQQGDQGWVAVTYSNMAECHLRANELDSARTYLERSLAIRRKRPKRLVMAHVLSRLGHVEMLAGRPKTGLPYCQESLAIAEELQLSSEERYACDCLYRIYEALGRSGDALAFYKRAISIRDSLFSTEQARAITRIEMGHLFDQQQLADSLRTAKDRLKVELAYMDGMNRVRNTRNLFIFWSALVVLAAIGLWSRLRYVRRSQHLLQQERDRNEELLHNILPRSVANELLANGRAEAREYEQATILFTDFHDFTAFSEKVSATELVATIDTCFSAFDEILERHGVEKIKTVGDAYVAAGGVPDPLRCGPECVVRAALAMQAFMGKHRRERLAQGLPALSMRVGIHTGPVVAGVVGRRKFAYDIWGDTVNTAARLESSGEVGKVNLSGSTYALVRHLPDLRFIRRGMVHAKGKGLMEMYYAEASVREPELSMTAGT
jgi:class 3 adenylate cyclase/Tfp pilus assembly protein PilF